jgi:nitronate monooxygenase
MRDTATKAGDIEHMQAWAGQSAGLALAIPAGELVGKLWREATELLG